MNKKEKNKYKKEFNDVLQVFVEELKGYISSEDGHWTIKGFIDIYKNIFTISSDTKIVSKILEIHIFPEILHFAEKHRYKVVLAEKQNWYPDITFIRKDNSEVKFALDIKTTYRKNNKSNGFTLGSHGAYFKERDKDKNIQYPYSQYVGHYCLGIIYTRSDDNNVSNETTIYEVQELEEKYGKSKNQIHGRVVTKIEDLKSITSVIKDFDFFAAEKWRIASDKQGSGNTANIGSIADINDLKTGNGVFSKLGEEWFDEYWINYGTVYSMKNGMTMKITSITDFLRFRGREDLIKKIVSKQTKTKK